MKQFTTKGIVLTRTNFGEADRILTFLTADHGKVKAIAKGVRKAKSKLAGGIELFSISDLTLIIGKGEINTIISSRLVKHYSHLAKDLDRSNMAYGFITKLNKATQENTEPEYFELLKTAFEGLDNTSINPLLSEIWFNMQLLKLAGHKPNLTRDSMGTKLTADKFYIVNFDRMCFDSSQKGDLTANHIKFLRVGFAVKQPQVLQRVQKAEDFSLSLQPIIGTMVKTHLRT